ncbi:MAG TPA: EamA family transporter [Candidatus Limnocylindria bacterium]|nr:EamA family transporter [Candidatus Limnocylindria bacterium]
MTTTRAAPPTPSAGRIWAALLAVYVVWGSTYLAIRVAVESLPPFLMAAVRHLAAGAILYAIAIRRGDREGDRPTRAGWRAALVIGAALLVGGNGGVVWAEQYVSSGLAALFVSTVPIWMAVLDRVVYGAPIVPRVLAGLLLGFGGVALLVGRVETGGAEPWSALALLVASLSWASGSLYARGAPLPRRPLVGTAMQMLAGGACLLVVSVVAGEPARLDAAAFTPRAVGAVLYLTVAGSLVGFTAYVWLLGVAPISLVSTYAYVNPVVAVLLGWAVLSEPLTPRLAVAGAAIVLAVALIATRPRPGAAAVSATAVSAAAAPRR